MTVMELSFWIMDILPAELRTHEFVSHILEMKAPLEITRGPEGRTSNYGIFLVLI
jgi:hypothetical protein